MGAFEHLMFTEQMKVLYMPVKMADDRRFRLPPALRFALPIIQAVLDEEQGADGLYVYLTAKHGFATPDNPLNRPGWHTDGFGTNDINYIWWRGAGTRFAVQDFDAISEDHVESMAQFEEQVEKIFNLADCHLYRLNPFVVHNTPEIQPPGQMRSWIKVSISGHRYNLMGNAHNYEFDYSWRMHDRAVLRNDPHRAQVDFYEPV